MQQTAGAASCARSFRTPIRLDRAVRRRTSAERPRSRSSRFARLSSGRAESRALSAWRDIPRTRRKAGIVGDSIVVASTICFGFPMSGRQSSKAAQRTAEYGSTPCLQQTAQRLHCARCSASGRLPTATKAPRADRLLALTPLHTSWVDQIELFFGVLGRRCLRHAGFCSGFLQVPVRPRLAHDHKLLRIRQVGDNLSAPVPACAQLAVRARDLALRWISGPSISRSDKWQILA